MGDAGEIARLSMNASTDCDAVKQQSTDKVPSDLLKNQFSLDH
jgi:hypothetical protein